MNPAPPLPAGMKRWEKIAVRVSHVGFYVLLIFMPLKRMGRHVGAGPGHQLLLVFDGSLLPIGGGREMARTYSDRHEMGMKVVYVLVALHVLAALKHHLELERAAVMLPFLPKR